MTIDRLTLDTLHARYAELCTQHGVTPAPQATHVIVYKAKRLLELWQRDVLLATLAVIVGREPIGHKQREGDLRTPEGRYRICYRNPESRFHLFLGLDYPSSADAARGLAEGLIDSETHARLCEAHANGDCPDWKTPLGGEVGLHGGGIDRDGTAGCIAMPNTDIELVWAATVVGTPVDVHA